MPTVPLLRFHPAARRSRPVATLVAWAFAWGLLASSVAAPAPVASSSPQPSSAAGETAPPAEFHRAVAPHVHLARQAVRRGEWPLWNDRAGAGYPLLSTAGGQLLHPFTALLYPLPAAAWLPLLAWLRIATGLGLAAWLLRRLGVRPEAALAGGAAYGIGVASLAALPAGTYAAVAPGLLLAATTGGAAVWNAAEGGVAERLRAAAPFLAFAALFAGGDPAAVALGTLFATAFLVARAAPLPPAARRRRLGGWLASGGLAALVTAPILVTTFHWHSQTYPARHFARQRVARLTRDPLELEQGLGMSSQAVDLDLLRGPDPAWTSALGLALLLLAATAWWLGRRREAADDETVAESGAAFPVPVFAALGLAAWLEVARPPAVSSLLEYYRLPPAAELAGAPGLPWLLLALAALAAACLAATPAAESATAGSPAHTPSPRRRRRHLLAFGAVASLLLTLLPVLRTPAPPGNPDLEARLQALQRDTGYSRMAVLGPLLPPETLAPHGLSDVRGHLPYLPAANVDALQGLLPPAGGDPALAQPDGPLAVAHGPLHRLLGVRWKVTPPWPPAGEPGAAPPGRSVAHLAGASLFESADALPLLFVPRQVRTLPAPDGWVDWVRKNRDFAHRSLAPPPRRDLGPASAPHPGPGREGGPGELRLEEIHATHLRADLEAHRRRLVASSVYQDGGWRALTGDATADGAGVLEPVPTTLANGPFVAVWMPPGGHRLDLLYRPPGFAAALAASALGLALLLALLLPAPRRLRQGARP